MILKNLIQDRYETNNLKKTILYSGYILNIIDDNLYGIIKRFLIKNKCSHISFRYVINKTTSFDLLYMVWRDVILKSRINKSRSRLNRKSLYGYIILNAE
jgi:hypothetical protein